LTSGLNDQNRYVASKATADANRNSKILFVNRGRATGTFYHQIRPIDEENSAYLAVLCAYAVDIVFTAEAQRTQRYAEKPCQKRNMLGKRVTKI
jgi:hypothetical protein